MAHTHRLLVLLHGSYPDDPRVAREVRAATAAGFEVDVIALANGCSGGDPPAGVRCIRLPIGHRRGAGLLATVVEYVAFTVRASIKAGLLGARRRYDVVQVHSPPDFLVLAAAGPRLLGARILLDVHDLSSDMFMMRFGNRRGAGAVDRGLRLVERVAGRYSAAVITVHEPYRRELGERGISIDKVTVVMNSLDEALLPKPAPPETQSFRVVYHGTVTPHYGVGLLLDAVVLARHQVPDIRLEIYGAGDALPELRRRARDLDLDRHVAFSDGALPQADALRAVRGASVGVVPNLPTRLNRFALSTKLLEYVALGIPAVSADLPTIREHFSENEVRFFEAGSAVSLAEALVEVASVPEAARERAVEATRRYEQYRWERSAAKYVRVLEALANKR